MAAEYLLPLILLIAGLGGVLLVTLSSLALFRRQSLSYFLVTLAIATLVVRSFLGTVMLGGLLSDYSHHLLEHVLDIVVIGLLFTAVLVTRRIDTTAAVEAVNRGPNE